MIMITDLLNNKDSKLIHFKKTQHNLKGNLKD